MPIVFQTPPVQAINACRQMIGWLLENKGFDTPQLQSIAGPPALVLPHRVALAFAVNAETIEPKFSAWRFGIEQDGTIPAAISARPDGASYRFSELNQGHLVQSFFAHLATSQARLIDAAARYEPILLLALDVRSVAIWLRPEASLRDHLHDDDLVVELFPEPTSLDRQFQTGTRYASDLLRRAPQARVRSAQGG